MLQTEQRRSDRKPRPHQSGITRNEALPPPIAHTSASDPIHVCFHVPVGSETAGRGDALVLTALESSGFINKQKRLLIKKQSAAPRLPSGMPRRSVVNNFNKTSVTASCRGLMDDGVRRTCWPMSKRLSAAVTLSLCSGGEQSDMLTHQLVAQVKEGLFSPFSPLSSFLLLWWCHLCLYY